MEKEHRTANKEQFTNTYRYPGVTPFSTVQANIFFGRAKDTHDLYRLIRREPLVVLYGKSGLGKSSLINAGIVPLCQQYGFHQPIVIRFGAWTEGTQASPIKTAKTMLADGRGNTFLDRLLPGEASLWYYAKSRQLLAMGGHQDNTATAGQFEPQISNPPISPLLMFDQFEELFSYPEEQVRIFQEELSELLNTGIPLRFRRLAEVSEALSEEEEDYLETPLNVRILFAIRSDRIHLLDRLKNHLPNVLRHTYELKALTKEDAKDAILLPTSVDGGFVTPKFDYSPEALAKILTFLEDEQDQRIEGILLQMLCEHYERRLVGIKGCLLLDLAHVGDPELVVKKYYDEKIEGLPAGQRLQARRLIEDGLVSEGESLRLTLHESYIQQEFGVGKTMLEQLVDSRLLRSEPFLRGGYTYELSHDRLVPPVVKARNTRREEEARLEAARLEQERKHKLEEAQKQAAIERKLRGQAEANEKRARQRTRLAASVSFIALVLAFFSGWSYLRADKARKEAFNNALLATQKTEDAKKALENLKSEQAAKEKLWFGDLYQRSEDILNAGICPNEIFIQLQDIAVNHLNDDTINAKYNSIKVKMQNLKCL